MYVGGIYLAAFRLQSVIPKKYSFGLGFTEELPLPRKIRGEFILKGFSDDYGYSEIMVFQWKWKITNNSFLSALTGLRQIFTIWKIHHGSFEVHVLMRSRIALNYSPKNVKSTWQAFLFLLKRLKELFKY